ncbi:MAG: hypothetical protein RR252_08930, partial [Longicatena sp.]
FTHSSPLFTAPSQTLCYDFTTLQEKKEVKNMLLDFAMVITLVAGFGIVQLFAHWCEKQR